MHFGLTKPCGNCPFKKEGAIELRPGRLEGIKETLLHDHNFFQCHKTVHHPKTGGTWTEDANGEHDYTPSGREHVCAGALIWQYKHKRLPIVARLAVISGELDLRELAEGMADVID